MLTSSRDSRGGGGRGEEGVTDRENENENENWSEKVSKTVIQFKGCGWAQIHTGNETQERYRQRETYSQRE